jgi:hypothetical protein
VSINPSPRPRGGHEYRTILRYSPKAISAIVFTVLAVSNAIQGFVCYLIH